jgi:mono/diheme cytochrome c family protein
MKRALRWAGYGLLGVLGLVVVALSAVYGASEYRIRKSYEVHPAAVAFQTDEETLARGRHVATIRGCVDCHGENLGGKLFIEAPGIGRLYATNLTRGEGGAASTYTVQDFVRAIRHGIGPTGKPLLFMPSHEFYPLSEEDLGALIAYLQHVPPVDGAQPVSSIGPIARTLFLAGQFPLLPAELIDHAAPLPTPPRPGITVEYGEYLSTGCIGCHGSEYGGGKIPGAPPEFPPGANLTPHETGLAGWTEADFFRALREGKRPDGTELNPIMPWQLTAQMTDDEIRAMWLYMQSLPPKPYGTR